MSRRTALPRVRPAAERCGCAPAPLWRIVLVQSLIAGLAMLAITIARPL